MRLAIVASIAALFTVSACSKGQTFKQGMRVLCNSPDKAREKLQAAPPAYRASILAKWLDEKVTNQEARNVIAEWTQAAPDDRSNVLMRASKRAGFESCRMASGP